MDAILDDVWHYGQGFGSIHDIMDASLDDVWYYGWGLGLIHDIMDAHLDDVWYYGRDFGLTPDIRMLIRMMYDIMDEALDWSMIS